MKIKIITKQKFFIIEENSHQNLTTREIINLLINFNKIETFITHKKKSLIE